MNFPFHLPGRGALKLPLFVTRQVLYGFILFTAIVLVLLPLSIVTYLNFYKMLIPTERIQVATKFYSGDTGIRENFTHAVWDRSTRVDPLAVLPFVTLNQDLTFLVRLNLHAICQWEKSFQMLHYTFKLSDDRTIVDELLVNCDLRYIYVEKNRLVPYNLRYWVPPILVDIFKTVKTDWPIVYLHGSDLAEILRKLEPIFKFVDAQPILIDSRKTTIDFVVEWEGIRYYMVNFYITSFVVGAGGFWLLSSWICILSSLLFQSYFLTASDEKVQIKKEI